MVIGRGEQGEVVALEKKLKSVVYLDPLAINGVCRVDSGAVFEDCVFSVSSFEGAQYGDRCVILEVDR